MPGMSSVRQGHMATIFPWCCRGFDKTKYVGWIWMVFVMVIGKRLWMMARSSISSGTQHTQFESGLAVFLFLVSQLLSFFKPAWDTFQNWLAGVRHPDCVLQRPRTYSVNCLQGCMLLSLAESTCAYRGSNKREEADDSVFLSKFGRD